MYACSCRLVASGCLSDVELVVHSAKELAVIRRKALRVAPSEELDVAQGRVLDLHTKVPSNLSNPSFVARTPQGRAAAAHAAAAHTL